MQCDFCTFVFARETYTCIGVQISTCFYYILYTLLFCSKKLITLCSGDIYSDISYIYRLHIILLPALEPCVIDMYNKRRKKNSIKRYYYCIKILYKSHACGYGQSVYIIHTAAVDYYDTECEI